MLVTWMKPISAEELDDGVGTGYPKVDLSPGNEEKRKKARQVKLQANVVFSVEYEKQDENGDEGQN